MATVSERSKKLVDRWYDAGYVTHDTGRDDEIISWMEESVEQALLAERQKVWEEVAKIAEEHGRTLGESCWNHENSGEGNSTCWDEIAKALRAAAEKEVSNG